MVREFSPRGCGLREERTEQERVKKLSWRGIWRRGPERLRGADEKLRHHPVNRPGSGLLRLPIILRTIIIINNDTV
jgi:hypothetical protein